MGLGTGQGGDVDLAMRVARAIGARAGAGARVANSRGDSRIAS